MPEPRQPPCEAVSWNAVAIRGQYGATSQPPCEAVSWNAIISCNNKVDTSSASLWGCELKYLLIGSGGSRWVVSLLVRLWVEINNKINQELQMYRQPPCEAVSWNMKSWCSLESRSQSASLWGCELKYIATRWSVHDPIVSLLVRLWVEISIVFFVPSGKVVSLLVRLWVEMMHLMCCRFITSSASLWGCELKYLCIYQTHPWRCQPPCEAVSWNSNEQMENAIDSVSLLVRLWVEIFTDIFKRLLNNVSLLVRLWVEMPEHRSYTMPSKCQPPCEAVSWNMKGLATGIEKSRQPPCEAVSWNIVVVIFFRKNIRQPPCEAVSWNVVSLSGACP